MKMFLFQLGGLISPVNGVGPDDLNINTLVERIKTEETTPVKTLPKKVRPFYRIFIRIIIILLIILLIGAIYWLLIANRTIASFPTLR